MAKELPPYTSSTGLLKELFKKIQEAPPPPRFSLDFLFSNLKFKKSGATNAFIPFLKRLGFLSSDGTPTEIYKRFRNPNPKISGTAMAEALKIGYSDLYNRNEYWHNLNKNEFKNFIVEVLELDVKNPIVSFMSSTVDALKTYANFDNVTTETETEPEDTIVDDAIQESKKHWKTHTIKHSGLNLSYTINLNLPETSDIKVFDAIFKSLRDNILNK